MTRALFPLLSFILILTCGFRARATDIEELLTQAINKNSFAADPKVKFYHYYSLEKPDPRIETSEGREIVAGEHLKLIMSFFWNPGITDNGMMNAGAGLYAAVDPLASETYGTIALEIRIKNGLKILDLYKGDPLYLSNAEGDADVIATLRDHPFLDSSLLKVGLRGDFAGRKTKAMFARIFKKLNIVGAEYDWLTANRFCENGRRNAVVIFGRQVSSGSYDIDPKDFDFRIFRSDFQNLTSDESVELETIQKRRRFLDRFRTIEMAGEKPLERAMSETGFADAEVKNLKGETLRCN